MVLVRKDLALRVDLAQMPVCECKLYEFVASKTLGLIFGLWLFILRNVHFLK